METEEEEDKESGAIEREEVQAEGGQATINPGEHMNNYVVRAGKDSVYIRYWVCMFTCPVTRAVPLEVLRCLSTEEFGGRASWCTRLRISPLGDLADFYLSQLSSWGLSGLQRTSTSALSPLAQLSSPSTTSGVRTSSLKSSLRFRSFGPEEVKYAAPFARSHQRNTQRCSSS